MAVRYDFNSQRSFVPYPSEVLPEGFCYPEGYLQHSQEMLYPGEFTWWFIDFEKHGPSAWEIRLYWNNHGWSALAGIDPIPFARDGDWAAFFDGSDKSGDPQVVVVDLGNKEHGIKFENFDAWLAAMKSHSGIGEPPYDKIAADPSCPSATEKIEGYFLCPICFEGHRPLKEYDDAIHCEKCDTVFKMD